jgi:hypothetical protein
MGFVPQIFSNGITNGHRWGLSTDFLKWGHKWAQMGIVHEFTQMVTQMAADGLVCICAFICEHLWIVLIHEFSQMVSQMVADGDCPQICSNGDTNGRRWIGVYLCLYL